MTSIGPASLLLAEIRAQAAARRRPGPARSSSAKSDHRPGAAASEQDWSAALARAVVAIDPDDPQRRRKAFREFLQAVLARECAIELPEDAAFQSLVDQVHAAMDLDPRLREAMAKAGDMLLESARG